MASLLDDAMMPFGYSGLTPDQAAMVQNQGYYMRPDAIQAGNAPWQQPAGYSNLTPDQIQAVDQQGYYTQGTADQQGQGQQKSLWDKLTGAIGSSDFKDLQKSVAGLGPQQGAATPAIPPSPLRNPYASNPYFNIYRHLQLDPRAALKSLMGGNLY